MRIFDLATLLKTLERLPPSKPGLVRLFRGQNSHHEKLLPSLLRPGASRTHELTWRVYANLLAGSILKKTLPNSGLEAVDRFVYWLQAMAQHYGGGSEYLDVTHDPEIALWFALHRAEPHRISGLLGNTQEENFPFEFRGVDFHLIDGAGHGYLYVIDAARDVSADQSAIKFVDIAEAPAPFSSPRVQAQSACLITASQGATSWNWKDLCVCEPLEVALPMNDSKAVGYPTARLFPPPESDPWYERFLSLPLVPQIEKEYARFGFAIPVDAYLSDLEEVHKYFKRVVALNPPLFFHSTWPKERKVGSFWKPKRLADALPILIEAPVAFASPPVDSGVWNYELLMNQLPAVAEAGSLREPGKKTLVRLDSVFLEFSPLETAWEDETDLIRAIWLWREKQSLVAKFYIQAPGTDRGYETGPIKVVLDPEARRFRMIGKDRNEDLPHRFLTHLVAAIAMLGQLRKGWKITPFPIAQIDQKQFLVAVSNEIESRLFETQIGHYVVRNPRTNAPYVLPGNYGSPVTLTVSGEGAFSELQADALNREALEAIVKSGRKV